MIAFNIGGRRFSANWFPTLLVLVVIPLMCSLGMWQYGRAQEKVALQEQLEQRFANPAMSLAEVKNDLSSHRYQTIRITGRYDSEHQFILDNQPREWQSGYAVITPFELDSGETVLVNRGWQPQPPSRQVLPDIKVATTSRQIHGKIDVPGKAFGLGPMTLEQGWPLRIQYMDYKAVAEQLGKPVLPMILMLSDDESDGFVRQWRPVKAGPMKHYGYMFQWFAMATAVLVLYIVLNLRKREGDE